MELAIVINPYKLVNIGFIMFLIGLLLFAFATIHPIRTGTTVTNKHVFACFFGVIFCAFSAAPMSVGLYKVAFAPENVCKKVP